MMMMMIIAICDLKYQASRTRDKDKEEKRRLRFFSSPCHTPRPLVWYLWLDRIALYREPPDGADEVEARPGGFQQDGLVYRFLRKSRFIKRFQLCVDEYEDKDKGGRAPRAVHLLPPSDTDMSLCVCERERDKNTPRVAGKMGSEDLPV